MSDLQGFAMPLESQAAEETEMRGDKLAMGNLPGGCLGHLWPERSPAAFLARPRCIGWQLPGISALLTASLLDPFLINEAVENSQALEGFKLHIGR